MNIKYAFIITLIATLSMARVLSMELPQEVNSTNAALLRATLAPNAPASDESNHAIIISDHETSLASGTTKRNHTQLTVGAELIASTKKAKTSDAAEKQHKCNFTGCKESFDTKHNLICHNNSAHPGYNQFKCNVAGCGHSASQESALKTHMLNHNYDNPFKCHLCCFSCDTQRGITIHTNYSHNGQKQGLFACLVDGCNESFDRKYDLESHIKKMHPTERTFKCEFEGCTFSTAHKFSLTVHTRSHTKQDLLKCTFAGCTKTFTQKSNLTTHERTHTGEKPYRCTFEGCNQAFGQASNLTRHLNNHNHDKPGWCNRGIYSTDTHRGLQKHIKRSHTNPQQKPGTMLAGDHQDNSSQESLPELDEQDINLLEQNNPELSLLSPQPVRKNDLGDEFEEPLPLLDADQIEQLTKICPELNTPGQTLYEEEPLPQTPMGANLWDSITENDINNLFLNN